MHAHAPHWHWHRPACMRRTGTGTGGHACSARIALAEVAGCRLAVRQAEMFQMVGESTCAFLPRCAYKVAAAAAPRTPGGGARQLRHSLHAASTVLSL